MCNVDITQDDENIHPPNICSTCHKTLLRYQDKLEKEEPEEQIRKKIKVFDIYDFTVHTDNCVICFSKN